MPKIRIIGPIDDKTRALLIALLREAGFEIVENSCEELAPDAPQLEKVEPQEIDGESQEFPLNEEGEPAKRQGEEVCVVVLTPECIDDRDLSDEMRGAAGRGCRVIGIWPPGATSGQLPRAVDDYGADTVPWDSGRIRDAIAPTCTSPDWALPNGQPRPQPQTKRNRC